MATAPANTQVKNDNAAVEDKTAVESKPVAEGTFFVKNVSMRLVGFAGKHIAPDETVEVVDDKAGVNRATLDGDVNLKIVNSGAKAAKKSETQKLEEKAISEATETEVKTATGAAWG